MATKATLENLVIAQKAQLDKLAADFAALSAAKPEPKATKPAPALVTRGYFKREDTTTGKWVDNTEKPCIIVTTPGSKPAKMTEETFVARFVTHHDAIVTAYKALA